MPKIELNRTIKKSQRGAVIVLFALLLPVLFGFMGLGIDVGLAYVEKGKVQDIADSAALAGAAHLDAAGNYNGVVTKAAVQSFAVANAREEVRAMAKHVIGDVSEGAVLEQLERFLVKRKNEK